MTVAERAGDTFRKDTIFLIKNLIIVCFQLMSGCQPVGKKHSQVENLGGESVRQN